MKSVACIFVLLVVLSTPAAAQYFPGHTATTRNEISSAIIALSKASKPYSRVHALLRLSSLYLFKPGEEKTDLDSAKLLFEHAKVLSRQMNYQRGIDEAILLTAGRYAESGDLISARKQLSLLTDSSRLKLLNYLSQEYFYKADSYKPLKLSILDTAKLLSRQALELSSTIKRIKDGQVAVDALAVYVMYYSAQGLMDQVKNDYAYIIEHIGANAHETSKAVFRVLLGQVYFNEGDYIKAMQNGLLALKELHSDSPAKDVNWVYQHIGHIYRLTNNYEKSNYYYLKILRSPEKYDQLSLYAIANSASYNFRALKQPQKALDFLVAFSKLYPPKTEEDKVYLHRAFGQNYIGLDKFALAEKELLIAIQLSEKINKNPNALYMYLGTVYFRLKEYKKAEEALAKCEALSAKQHVAFLTSLYALRSQVDSTLGDFHSALIYISKSKKINDSIYTVSKEKHTQELAIQYETQKKEAQIRQNEANIRILNQENILQQQKVKLQQSKLDKAALLDQKNQAVLQLKESDLQLRLKDLRSVKQVATLQRTKLQQAEFNKAITVAIIVLLLAIILLIYRQFRQKQRSAKIVDEKNKQLNQLISEKDWLLKEVHHRVKNNLQIIISLLESQANYLDDVALAAIKTSQNRIYAMSLIHQKLYQSEQTKTIDMANYIPELIGYLGESFDDGKAIRYDLDIDPVKIDVSRAIPIGLILNEVVTNSLKYAFKDRKKGLMTVQLKLTGANVCRLVITDDGIGLSAVPSTNKPDSMGMKLIRGLTRELNGQMELKSNNGTQICISSLLIDTASVESKIRAPKPAAL